MIDKESDLLVELTVRGYSDKEITEIMKKYRALIAKEQKK